MASWRFISSCAPLAITCACLWAAPNALAAEVSAFDPATLLRAQQEVYRAAVARAAPWVVTIETVGGSQPVEATPTTRPAAGRRRGTPPAFIVAEGPTTGLIYSADGLILTSAFNFVRDPSLITVILPDRRRFVATLLAKDQVRQIAMLKIPATGLSPAIWVKSQAEVRVGQTALALGRGLGGDSPALTAGIISGLNRQSGLAIQTDARLSPANFGGPLIDLEGRVIGLSVPMGLTTGVMAGVELYDSGIGFAVPAWQIEVSARQLAEEHNVRPGLLGVKLGGGQTGLTVQGVGEPSPAQRAGVEEGDRLIEVDGQPVKKYRELQRLMRVKLAGQRVKIAVLRDGKRVELSLVLAVPEDIGAVPATSDDDEPVQTQPTPDHPEPPRRESE